MHLDDNQKDLNKMINRYVAGKATAEEIIFIEAYYKHLEKEGDILDQLEEDDLAKLGEIGFESILKNINQPKVVSIKTPFYKNIVAAAVFIALISSFLFLSREQIVTQNKFSTKQTKIDVLPGVDKATLTLSDGSTIVLDDAKNENILEREGLTISKTTDGQLLYRVNSTMPKATVVAYNTIATSKGNQYQVLLPDGTKVWLNAGSSLKYPELFTGNERQVSLTGEAYFEVAKNKNMPFVVLSRNQKVNVLGTHFNINSYIENKVIKTTLIEGSIKVNNSIASKILVPGDQSLVEGNGSGQISINKNVDLESQIAWKNGLFNFNNEELKSILGQLERWYDIKIDYQSVPNKRYNGMVSRKSKLSEVLNMLELTGNISFKIEEDKRLKVIIK